MLLGAWYNDRSARRDCALKGFARVLRDRTERKRFEELLNERNQALEAADRRKDELLAVLAHELRNPLAPIFNALALLEDESIPTDAQRKAQRIIGRQVRTLSRLMDDLLDVSRITRGRIQLRKATLTLQGILLNALGTCPGQKLAGVARRQRGRL